MWVFCAKKLEETKSMQLQEINARNSTVDRCDCNSWHTQAPHVYEDPKV